VPALLLTLIMTVAALGACDRFVGVVEPREEEDFAKQYIALFQVGDFDALKQSSMLACASTIRTCA
jgi:hypothetical protein